jgi:GT2 family glycosyltransferase
MSGTSAAADLLPLSVVVTNYNTTALTVRCIDGIRRHLPRQPAEIIVVDDASSERISGELPDGVTLVTNESNQGYVRSVNIGVARATQALVLLLDSDATPLDDVGTAVVDAFAAAPQLGALGFGLVDRNGSPTGATQPEPTELGLALGQVLEHHLNHRLPREQPDWFTIHSCAIAFRRQTFIDVGGFDDGFDFLDADTDFSMRLWRAGWELSMAKSVRILHEGSGSPQTTARRVVRHHVNRWRLLEKHGLITHAPLLKSALAARHVAELIWFYGPARFVAGMTAERRLDKLSSRMQLLASVWRGYSARPSNGTAAR